ncbi:hypothetical protein [Candidatus Poriferisodalis sp.]|uniref:hypothetical protein n=1 Tax=Candidatus Poriferisodalis sp. TaxID=3101277 RepID=UPI003B0168E5
MSAPILALALAAMCAAFSAAVSDTAFAIAHRNEVADEARRVATLTLDGCALGDGATRRCAAPPTCTKPGCSVCWRDGALRADVSVEWSPLLLRGLTPASGRHALSLAALDVADLAGSTLPACI